MVQPGLAMEQACELGTPLRDLHRLDKEFQLMGRFLVSFRSVRTAEAQVGTETLTSKAEADAVKAGKAFHSALLGQQLTSEPVANAAIGLKVATRLGCLELAITANELAVLERKPQALPL
ncbi:hypothetical protein FRX31_032525 [Thalictrum thalictroides]|uniref:Uncharacterized protein n=1 Tax=Thalictrum thalictroides TaxID=46969 RepID=A0A7J6V0J9_THATH|nr:hypothetical protein FRX31_032525 [Thalictrum thalictroides]